jgi:uncharacterized cupin superfamily protein
MAENGIVTGEGYSVGSLDALGSGPGFRKIRRPLGVTAFGINAIVLPPGYHTGEHYHEHQEETYFLHAGEVTISFGDGSSHVLRPGGIARVAARTVRGIANTGEADAVFVVVGGKDGYVERDGVRVRPLGPIAS